MSSTTRNLIISVTRRLLIAIGICFLICVFLFTLFHFLGRPLPVAFAVLLVGALGGFIGIQRRLRSMKEADLELLLISWECTLLPPFVGGILAILLFCVFLSGLISGSLFPTFSYMGSDDVIGLSRLFETRSDDVADYAKLFVWSFIAGYSERFVVGILGSLESRSGAVENTEEIAQPEPK